jgi:ParB-like chromosome segregation protein Spo0J
MTRGGQQQQSSERIDHHPPKIDPEYKDLLPPYQEGEYEALKQSIEEDGQLEPIIVSRDGRILDGHTRLKICQELGKTPLFEAKDFPNRLEEKKFVITINLRRRQLNDFQKIEVSQVLLETEKLLAKHRHGRKNSEGKLLPIGSDFTFLEKGEAVERVARDIGVKPRTYYRGLAILKKAEEPLKDKLRAGKVEINTAYADLQALDKRNELIALAKDRPTPPSVKLYLGDFEEVCRSRITRESIDLIITDPPYPINEFPLEKWEALAVVAKRSLKPGAFFVTYSGQEHLPEITERLSHHLTWFWQFGNFHSSNETMIHDKKVRNRFKPILIYTNSQRGARAIEHQWMFDALTGGKGDKALHEEAQPESEAEYFIEKLTEPGAVVLDPLLGSGTTVRAAYKLGRESIGIEKDPERLEIARSSIALTKPYTCDDL